MQTDLHDAYIATFPDHTQTQLQRLRAIIRSVLPDAEETIAYSMPAFRQRVNLVYYAGFKNHISLFPTAAPIDAFAGELKGFKTSKGTIQFPLDQPLPEKLIKRIVKWRLAEALKSR
jgi:uncharacterized protein YdhG (YjbR/CyaY superfamily)